GTQAHPDAALHAAHQRQGRTLHPDRPARMGLRDLLRDLGPAPGGAGRLAPPLQLASASHRCRWPGPDLKTGVQPKQPIEAPQLDALTEPAWTGAVGAGAASAAG